MVSLLLGLDIMNRLSSFALKTLQRFQSAASAQQMDSHWYRVGQARVPASLIAELERMDMIARHPEKGFCLTSPGAAYLRRCKTDKARRAPACRSKSRQAAVPNFTRQHQRLVQRTVVVNGRRENHQVNIGDTAIGWLVGRKDRHGNPYITAEMLESALRFQSDCELAGFGRIATSDPTASPPGRHRRLSELPDPSSQSLDARRRVDRISRDLGPSLADLLIRTCCFGEGLEQIESANAWPRRSGKLVLKIALERLASHYHHPSTA